MFDIGFWELILLSIVALLIVGPERLPRLVRTAGFWMGKARGIVADVREEVEREIRLEEVKRSLSQQSGADEFKKLADRVKSINADVQQTVSDKGSVRSKPSLGKEAPKNKPVLEKESDKQASVTSPDTAIADHSVQQKTPASGEPSLPDDSSTAEDPPIGEKPDSNPTSQPTIK